eukprot:3044941-Pyramimonas_sp.AAC.1
MDLLITHRPWLVLGGLRRSSDGLLQYSMIFGGLLILSGLCGSLAVSGDRFLAFLGAKFGWLRTCSRRDKNHGG